MPYWRGSAGRNRVVRHTWFRRNIRVRPRTALRPPLRRVDERDLEDSVIFLGATGGPPHETLVPPCGDCTAVSSSWSHTSGHPSASRQNSPASRLPSHEISPRKPQPARKLFPGSITQNFVAAGVGQHDVVLLLELSHVDVAAAEPQRRLDGVPLVLEG